MGMAQGDSYFSIGGTELARILKYYNQIYETDSLSQKIICPFHDDVNPSMMINLENGTWFCYGCNLSGDALKFVILMERKYHSLNDLQSCKRFVKILRSSRVSNIQVKRSLVKRESTSLDLFNQSYDYYYGLSTIDWNHPKIPEVDEAKQYMEARGFSADALNACQAKVTYNTHYGLIFPMLDNGDFRGWVCRTMLKEIEARRKYLYNEGFSRATTLVGDYGNKDYVFVVEGYMDRLKFLQYGKDNVVAILGWKMSQQQIQKLKDKGVKYVISALDNDACGKKGTKWMEGFFKVIRFQYLKGVKDPGEMSKGMFMRMYRKTMLLLKQTMGT